jgi:hypothetical protein
MNIWCHYSTAAVAVRASVSKTAEIDPGFGYNAKLSLVRLEKFVRQLIYTTKRPAMYHGHGKRPPFFEGWYYKLISADSTRRYAIIPGVILGDEGHAFVQVLDGVTGQSAYHIYPHRAFWASQRTFEVHIGPNRFTESTIVLDIDRPEGHIAGQLTFEGLTPWPVSALSPGIMGWYAWVPGMECYHGVVSLNHTIQGTLTIDHSTVRFDDGLGYIEKDWGQSFPAAWIWLQSNHFAAPGTCITASVAVIPWIRRSFPGFIIGLWHDNLLYRFATYTGAQIDHLRITDDHITWAVRSRRFLLDMVATRTQGGLLRGPTRENMGKRVDETLNATVAVRLSTSSGDVLFQGQGRHAGLEVQGDLNRLLALTN